MKTFIDIFLKACADFPEKTAIVDSINKVKYTFSEVELKARRIASSINQAGIAKNAIIPILMPDSADYLIAQFGVWLSGRAIAPLGDSFPKERVDYIKSHVESDFVLTADFVKDAERCEPLTQHIPHEKDDFFAIFYTSGSTGEPKGIVHDIESWTDGLERTELLGVNEDEVFVHNAPFYFIAQFVIFPYLFKGAEVHIIPAAMRRDMKELPRYIEQQHITALFISPSVLPFFETTSTELKRVFSGSEKMSGVGPKNNYELLFTYGMSETLPFVSYFAVDKPYENTPIGKAFPHVEIVLLDSEGKEVAQGEEGEICVRGKFTRGYLHKEEETKALFDGGVLHTNDIGRWDEKGCLHYVNRKDWMLKINGQRVEPGEVEEVIRATANVENAIVKGFEKEGRAFLCAYYTGDKAKEQDIREAILAKLPSYMLPSYFVKMETFPINQNGKLDRKSLQAPHMDSIRAEYVAPQSETERILAEGFEKVFNIEHIGADDDFFKLGGDSIRIMKLQTFCQKACPTMDLSSQLIFKGKSVAEIARLVDQKEKVELKKLHEYPLTQTQMGIYVECENRKGEIAYNLPRLFSFSKHVDAQRLANALQAVLEAHSYVKSRIKISSDGTILQVRQDDLSVAIAVERIDAIEEVKESLVKPFDLNSEALFRFRVFEAKDRNYLFFDLHHIIFDGSSFEVLVRDINAAYDGMQLEPEALTGFDIAYLEEENRKSSVYDEAFAWHTKEFDGLNVDSLPISDQKEEGAKGFGAIECLSKESVEAVEAFCQKTETSANIFFNAAFSYFLAAYHNSHEALYATIYHGRKNAASLNTISMLVKTLAVYQNIEHIETPKELIRSVQEQLLGSMNHDIFSFAEICEKFEVNSELMFAYQGDLNADSTLCGEPMRMEDLLENATGATLNIQLFKEKGRYRIVCEYSKAVYTEQLMTEFLASFDQVVSDFLVKSKLDDVRLVNEAQQMVLDEFNKTESDYDKEQTVVDLFRERAKEHPENIAVVYKEIQYTYAELDEATDNLAAYILNEGLVAEDVVAILIPRCEHMAIASLGVLKSTCAYQPLDPSYPQERLEFMVADSGAKLLIADESLIELLPNFKGKVLLSSAIASLPKAEVNVKPVAKNALNYLYTSGSTGLPKGCIIEHGNMGAFVHYCKNRFGISPLDNTTAYASFGFDASMYEIYMSLCWGATLHIIDEDIRLNLIELEQYFIDNEITIGFMTTQVARQFALSISDKTKLRHMLTGGEKLVAMPAPKSYTFHNVYGPTECTVFITSYPLNRKEENIPIGKSIENVKLYVVDAKGRRQPVGGVGELWASGAQVARGYLNRPEVMEKVFIPNPFTSQLSYERVYRTGDVVRYLCDGNIEFIGRKDAQVKIRGFRVELTEVEGIVREFPAVKDATVQAYDIEGGGKYIAAFIVGDEKIDIEALKAFILENKPPYIVPAVIMQIDAIPLNQNQKVNKKALPTPELVSKPEGDEDEGARPLNRLEQEVKNIVAEIVGTDKIGISTKLAYAGLTSISSIKLAIMLHKRFNISIDSKKLAKEYAIIDIENTILEQFLAGDSAEQSTSKDEASSKEHRTKSSYPLSYSQIGVYYECMKNPTTTTYNMPFLLRYPKSIRVEQISQALSQIIDTNPYLLTRFDNVKGEIVQMFSASEYKIETKQMDQPAFEAFKENFTVPFNLNKGPLFRACVVDMEEANYLFFDIHHLIFDGASTDIFLTQLNKLLDGKELDRSDYTYYDYIDDEKDAEETPAYAENERFFAEKLGECEGGSMIPLDLNLDPENGKLERVEERVNKEAEISAFCKTLGVSPAQFYLAAVSYTVSRFVNNKNVYLSTISNGRSNVKTAYTFGMFVKTLPLACFVKDQCVKDYILETGKDFEETLVHENYPYAKLASDFNFKPEIMYAYQVGVLNQYKVGEEEIALGRLGLETAKFKLAIHIETRNDKDCIVLEYNDALYSSSIMTQLAQSINAVISNFIADTCVLVKNVSILSTEQKTELERFRTVATLDGHLNTFYHGIEKAAEEKPDHMAIEAEDACLTYAEFNAEINKVAHRLIEKGIQKGDRVAILLRRSSKLLITMFGVNKAGAAYIPCDTEYPEERITHILDDSGAKYVITTEDYMSAYSDRAINVWDLFETEKVNNPNLKISPEDLAYIIYTSGSTGKPKGVLLRHAGISNYLYNHPANRHVHALVNDATKYLSVTTISFDMSLKEIGVALYNGVTLVFANEDETTNPIALAKLFQQTGADAFNATPSRMLQFMELDELCDAFARCKVIMSGGEKFSDKLLRKLKETTSARIFNTYGPTEITVSSNARELTHDDKITIGAPLLNYTEYVVDCDGNELPRGVVGELYIGGVGVAVGYNNLPEQTAKAFVDYDGQRVYRSGDYAAWDEEGNVRILGRTDNQVKLRGLRIELGEIEACLTKVEGIKNAVAVIKKINGQEHIAAYFTSDKTLDPQSIRDEIALTLTAYMIPTAFLQMEALPMTPNGKTDIKALPEAKRLSVSAGEEAEGELEQSICDLYAKILDMDKVGATDSFFDIGGSSLLVTRVIIEASKLGYQVAYGDVFKNPSPRKLARFISGEEEEENEYADIADFDYAAIEQTLEANNLDSFREGDMRDYKRVLLAGASGFLGIHILRELLDTEGVVVHCLLRGRGTISAESRLKTLLFYYFENSYEELFGDRLFVVEGDLTKETELGEINVDTVINTAAIVKHFTDGNEMYDVNTGGVEMLIDFCLKNSCRFIQVSTMSVNGFAISPKQPTPFKEQELYKGQLIASKYIHSKFLAERAVLESIALKGLDAKIMRVGNLSARNSDGEFQINFGTNSFMNRLKVFNVVGHCPYEQFDAMVEFSAIDEVAKSILLLSKTPKACCVFHPFNNHAIVFGDILTGMEHLGIDIKAVESGEFQRIMEEAKEDEAKASSLTSVIAYENMAHGQKIVPNIKNNLYTMQVLYRMGYKWPVTSWDYIERFIESLLGLGFFNAD